MNYLLYTAIIFSFLQLTMQIPVKYYKSLFWDWEWCELSGKSEVRFLGRELRRFGTH